MTMSSRSTPTAPATAIPGPAAGARSCASRDSEKELSGGEAATTNNRMELMAVIRALEALKRPCRVALYTDSQYVQKGITSGSTTGSARLAHRRQEAGQERRPVARARRSSRRKHEIDWHWVKGHAGHPENERADALANKGIPDDAMTRQIVLDTETTGLKPSSATASSRSAASSCSTGAHRRALPPLPQPRARRSTWARRCTA